MSLWETKKVIREWRMCRRKKAYEKQSTAKKNSAAHEPVCLSLPDLRHVPHNKERTVMTTALPETLYIIPHRTGGYIGSPHSTEEFDTAYIRKDLSSAREAVLMASIVVMKNKLQYIYDITGEELEHAPVGTGAEIALRHANRMAKEALAEAQAQTGVVSDKPKNALGFEIPKSMDDLMGRKTMTLNLTDKEMAVLEKMADGKDMSKTAVMRQALRMYQLVDVKLSEGKKMVWFNADGTREAEMLMLMP